MKFWVPQGKILKIGDDNPLGAAKGITNYTVMSIVVLVNRDQVLEFKRKCEFYLVRTTIRRLSVKQQNSDEKFARLKIELRNKYRMSGSWIENTWKWLQKKALEKAKPKINFCDSNTFGVKFNLKV